MQSSPREEPRRQAPLHCPRESSPGTGSCSLLAVQGLALGIECLALSLLPVDSHEAFQVQRLARLLDALSPHLDARGLVALLGNSRRLLGDDLAELVARQLVLGHAAERLLLGAPQHLRPCELAPRNLAHAL